MNGLIGPGVFENDTVIFSVMSSTNFLEYQLGSNLFAMWLTA